jgi:hypothetical protein
MNKSSHKTSSSNIPVLWRDSKVSDNFSRIEESGSSSQITLKTKASPNKYTEQHIRQHHVPQT